MPGGSFSYDNNDRLGGDTSDANGNTISSAGIANTYDFENHMLSHGAVTLVYDGDGNRVAETVGGSTTKYLVDTLNPTGYVQVMDELVSGAVTRTYTYGLQRISENQKIGATQTASFYGYDGHGNVRFLTGTAGTVTDTYVYDAFGLPLTTTGTTPNNFLYSGEQFDSVLGMYYLRARYYNPATGRFLTMDPAQGTILDPPTLQKYEFARNNPVNATDPTGRDVVIEVAFLYARNNFGVLAAARVVLNPWELAEPLLTGKEQYENFGFGYALGDCDNGLLSTAALALGSLGGGSNPTNALNASNKFVSCLYGAESELLHPFPGINFPYLPEPPEE